jgi:ligand-binding SRPBCC domain-containing protein
MLNTDLFILKPMKHGHIHDMDTDTSKPIIIDIIQYNLRSVVSID